MLYLSLDHRPSSSSSDLSQISVDLNDTAPPPYPVDTFAADTTPYLPPPSYDDIFKDQK